jgi:hypothetical protein
MTSFGASIQRNATKKNFKNVIFLFIRVWPGFCTTSTFFFTFYVHIRRFDDLIFLETIALLPKTPYICDEPRSLVPKV